MNAEGFLVAGARGHARLKKLWSRRGGLAAMRGDFSSELALSARAAETMSDAYLNVPTQLAILSRDEINAASITPTRFMRAQLKVPNAEDEKLVEYAHIYQDINVARATRNFPNLN
ncbi:hypothetical protein ACJJTC_011175 [Scirpophaga incertulas]